MTSNTPPVAAAPTLQRFQVIARANYLSPDNRPGGLHCFALVAAVDRADAIELAMAAIGPGVAGMGSAITDPPRVVRAGHEALAVKVRAGSPPGVLHMRIERRGPFDL